MQNLPQGKEWRVTRLNDRLSYTTSEEPIYDESTLLAELTSYQEMVYDDMRWESEFLEQ